MCDQASKGGGGYEDGDRKLQWFCSDEQVTAAAEMEDPLMNEVLGSLKTLVFTSVVNPSFVEAFGDQPKADVFAEYEKACSVANDCGK